MQKLERRVKTIEQEIAKKSLRGKKITTMSNKKPLQKLELTWVGVG